MEIVYLFLGLFFIISLMLGGAIAGKSAKQSRIRKAVDISSSGATSEVVVTDIQMSFISMVVFMVKWAIASIPAFIIIFIIFTLFSAIFGGVIGGLSGSRY